MHKFKCCRQTIILWLSHVVAITHFTIQSGNTTLMQASFKGHHKVVELLLGAGANPDLQTKVSTEWDTGRVIQTRVMDDETSCIPSLPFYACILIQFLTDVILK